MKSDLKKYLNKNIVIDSDSSDSGVGVCPDALKATLELFHADEVSRTQSSENPVYWNGEKQVKEVIIPVSCADKDDVVSDVCENNDVPSKENDCRCSFASRPAAEIQPMPEITG